MVKITNIFGDRYSGQAGKAGVFANWKGRQYRRMYVVPSNPNTVMQQAVRGFFSNAVALWHTWPSLARLAFSYLVSGQVMSGFNLLVKRYQLAATKGATLPMMPAMGIKQIASDSTLRNNAAITTPNPFPLTYSPVKIGSLTYTPGGTDVIDMDAYVDLEMGDVRIPTQLTKIDGLKAALANLNEGDKLLISYTSGGRTITREVLYTVTSSNVIPALAAIGDALRTKYFPIDLGSVVVETEDVSAGPPHTFTQLESLEIQNCAYTMVGPVPTPQAYIFFDLTPPAHATSDVDYYDVVPIVGAKLEVMKVDTSFVTFRRYSDVVGNIPIAQTIEDETYDWNLSAPLFLSEIRAAQSAIKATEHEVIELSAAT